MKKFLVLLVSLFVTTVAIAQASTKVAKARIIQATKDTTVSYAGVKIFVPQGETVILGQKEDGSVVIRGQGISGIKVNNAVISFPGVAVLSVNPQNNVITVSRGEQVSVMDTNGHTAVLSQGASVSGTDIRAATVSPLASSPVKDKTQQALAKAQEKAAKQEAKVTKTATKTQTTHSSKADTTDDDQSTELPAFVADSVVSSAASEQAVQDVKETEETLSNSSAR